MLKKLNTLYMDSSLTVQRQSTLSPYIMDPVQTSLVLVETQKVYNVLKSALEIKH